MVRVCSPLSEFYGRRNVYIGAFAMFVIWLIPCALANNIATMLIGRFFVGDVLCNLRWSFWLMFGDRMALQALPS